MLSKPYRRLACALAIIGSVSLSAAIVQQRRRVDEGALRNPTAGEWITHGLNYAETRFSPLKAIDTSNVGRLGLLWTANVGVGGGPQEATPLVSNGVMYVITNWSVVYAFDARSGKELWRFDPKVDHRVGEGNTDRLCCGVVNRGLALYQGKVFVPVIDGRLAAVDAEGGQLMWETQTTPRNQPYSITMAPRVIKGKVIVGNSGGEYAVRGYVSAYDANSGRLAWRFFTVPGDPTKPFEHPDLGAAAKTWTGEWWKMGGGGTVWDAIAFDPDADLLYIGTGNGGPWNRESRSPGGGDNWYLSSILALRPDNGKYVWHYQTTPGDNWDYTAVQHLLLADLRINGRTRKVIMQAPKNGFFYVIDRVSGEFISAGPFADVNWAKGIDPKTGRPIENPEARYGFSPVALSPGPLGAHNWSPMSFNPITGLVYLPAGNNSAVYARTRDFAFKIASEEFTGTGQYQTGVTLGRGGAAASAIITPPFIGPEAGRGQRVGFLLAWDPVTQKERWRQPGGGGIGGGTVATAGNLVFQVIPDGRLVAYSADKGEKLLEVSIGTRGVGPPITYQLDGRQYVAFMGGQGAPGMALESVPVPPGSTIVKPPRVYTFALDGKAEMPGGDGQ
jgi:quinohemoprotein ethanol dehydrogenase